MPQLIPLTDQLKEIFSENLTMYLVIWGLYVGFVIASIGLVYSKRVPGRIVRALERQEAFSRDSAKTMEEIGIPLSSRVRRALKDGSVLRRYVEPVLTGEEPEREISGGKIARMMSLDREKSRDYDLASQKWHLNEEKRYEASVRYDPAGCNIPMIILSAVLLFGAALALSIYLPDILEWGKTLITS